MVHTTAANALDITCSVHFTELNRTLFGQVSQNKWILTDFLPLTMNRTDNFQDTWTTERSAYDVGRIELDFHGDYRHNRLEYITSWPVSKAVPPRSAGRQLVQKFPTRRTYHAFIRLYTNFESSATKLFPARDVVGLGFGCWSGLATVAEYSGKRSSIPEFAIFRGSIDGFSCVVGTGQWGKKSARTVANCFASFAVPGPSIACVGITRQISWFGAVGCEFSVECWHLPVCVKVTTSIGKGTATAARFHLGKNFGRRQCKFGASFCEFSFNNFVFQITTQTCQVDLVCDQGHKYFLSVLQDHSIQVRRPINIANSIV